MFYFSPHVVPATEDGEEEWHTFIGVDLGLVALNKEKNTITITALRDTTNVDYLELYSIVDLD